MFTTDPLLDVLLRGLILTALAMCWVVLLVRVNGLRSFSKMALSHCWPPVRRSVPAARRRVPSSR